MFVLAKRHAALLLLLALVLPIIAACGGGGTAEEATAEPTEVMEAPVEEPTEEPTEAMEEPTEAMEEPTEAMEEPTEAMEEPTEAPADGGEIALPAVNPAEVEGDIVTAGSSTVFPLTQRAAEAFTEEGYTGQITVDSIGTGAGFERFCVAAETDISNASRPISEEEIAACEENGRPAIEFRVGTDALAVVVSRENDFVDNLTIEQLAAIFSAEAATWADVNPDWPAEPIQLFSPGTDSGTFDYFVEEVFDEDEGPLLAANPQLSEDDNVLAQGVIGSPYAISYFGYAYYVENEDELRAISIEGVEPTAETAEDNSYPLSRPLFIYSAQSIMEEKPQVAAFINYYLTFAGEFATDVGYFPASVEAINEAKQNWLDAMGN